LEDEKRDWFWKWEAEILSVARKVGVADKLDAPKPFASNDDEDPLVGQMMPAR
jgi:hypothetical protein